MSQSNPPTSKAPSVWTKLLDIQFQLKLFWRLYTDPIVNPIWKILYPIACMIAVPLYIILPDPIVGGLDDFLVSWWAIPYVFSLGFVYLLCPRWLVNLHTEWIRWDDTHIPGEYKEPEYDVEVEFTVVGDEKEEAEKPEAKPKAPEAESRPKEPPPVIHL